MLWFERWEAEEWGRAAGWGMYLAEGKEQMPFFGVQGTLWS